MPSETERTRTYVTVEELEGARVRAVTSLVKLVETGSRLIGEVDLFTVEAQKACRDLEAAGEGVT